MQLHIRQRIFSWTDSYDIYAEDGNPRYEVKSRFFALTHRLHVYEKHNGREIGAVSQRLFSLLPTFDIEMEGRIVGTVRRKFTLLRQNYEVDFLGWDVEGDFVGWDYHVLKGPREILTITKQWLTWSDTYTLTFHNPADEIPGLLLVLAIDAANCSHND